MRASEEQVIDIVNLAVRPVAKMLEICDKNRHAENDFKRIIPYPVFKHDSNATYRDVDSASYSESPFDYGAYFGNERAWDARVLYSELPGFEELAEYIYNIEPLRQYLNAIEDAASPNDHVLRVGIGHALSAAVDRHIHCIGFKLDESYVRAFLSSYVSSWIPENLPIELVVPILNVYFDLDVMELKESVRIERMSDEFQLARWRNSRKSAVEDVLLMASHALVLKGWTIPNPHSMALMGRNGDESLDIPFASQFFQALAAYSNAPTGYVQVIYRPVGWMRQTKGVLPSIIHGPIVEEFSTGLRLGIEPHSRLGREQCEQLKRFFISIDSGDNAVKIASTRLWEAARRRSDVDRILDLCIGIESLIAGEPGDTAYKIAMRMAAVLSKCGIGSASQIMKAAKIIYGYRSSVAHGRGKPGKSLKIQWDGSECDTLDVAQNFLHLLLSSRLKGYFTKPEDVDENIIAQAIDSWGQQNQEPDSKRLAAE
jgi:hypothetical protein